MKTRALIGWGVGSFSSAALVSSIGLLHLRFMTDSLGLSMALAGSLVVISRLYDAFIDPVVGMVSDRTRTRFGRHRPYLLGGGLLAAISLVMLFNIPRSLTGDGLVGFVALSLVIFSTAYTLFRIPYLALGRSITQSFAERSKLMTFSVYGSSLGTLAATSAAPFLLTRIGSDRAGHGIVAIILAVLIAVGGTATFILLPSEPPLPVDPLGAPRHTSVKQAIQALRANKAFQRLIAFKVVVFTGLAVHLSAIPYFTRHVLRATDMSLSSLFLTQTLLIMASQPIWVRIAAKTGRRNGLLIAGLLEALVLACWSLIPAAHPSPWLQICGGLSGVGGGGLFLGLYTVLTDTMDETKRADADQSHEGILAGVFVMVEKATTALGTFVFSAMLSWFGFISANNTGSTHQPPGVITGILLSISAIPAAATLLGCWFLRNMRLERDTRVGGEVAFSSTAAAPS